ncbi:uncharacterized protein PRCAT00004107001 [Priceomyces carsonii]|uniref:uncharacterized protein n=1 Tax=Priceomyces carsonii TaxID=28549 RepID=UPI002ED9BAA3|nr:unnamed protein product [Priceomyces carsonii]
MKPRTCLIFMAYYIWAFWVLTLQTSALPFEIASEPVVTDIVTFTISQENSDAVGKDSAKQLQEIGNLEIGLFGLVVPQTVHNFVELSKMSQGYGYKGCKFHRIIKDFMIQGGDFSKGDGTGGYSIYDKGSFKDENFELKHNKLGRVSMANAGPNTNGAQFFIATNDDLNWLDGSHVVFGQLLNGFDTLQTLNEVQTGSRDDPIPSVIITDISIEKIDLNFNNTLIFDDYKYSLDKEGSKDSVQVPLLIDSTPRYYYFFGFFLLSSILVYVRKVYFRRQLLREVKDKNYY